MQDKRKTKATLIEELEELRQQVATLKANAIENKQLEEDENEEGLHDSLFQTMTQGVVYQIATGEIIAANPSAEQILGLTLDQMQGRTSIDPRWKAMQEDGTDFPGETHPAMVALKTGKEVRNTVMGVFNPQNETQTWITINAVPMFLLGESKPYQVYATFEDITQRKQAEIELKEAHDLLEHRVEERTKKLLAANLKFEREIIERKKVEEALVESKMLLDEVLETLPIGVGILDDVGNLIYVNPEGQKIWGGVDYVGLEGLGKYKGWWLESGEEVRNEDRVAVRAFVEGEVTLNKEMKIETFDGKHKIINASALPIRNLEQEITETVVIHQDITERKQAEEALQESERRLRSLIQNIQAAIVIHAADTRILQSNIMAQEIFGLDEDQLLGKTSSDPCWKFRDESGRDMPIEEYPVNRVLATQTTLDSLALGVYRTQTDDVIWVLVNGVPIFDQAGEIEQVIVTFVDITERRRVFAKEREQRDFTKALRDTAEALNNVLEFDDALDAVLAGVTRVTQHDVVNIHLIDTKKNSISHSRYQGYEENDFPIPTASKINKLLNLPNLKKVIAYKQACIIPDTDNDPEWVSFPSSTWIRSCANVPIIFRGELIGLINLEGSQPNTFTPAHIEQLQIFAHQAAIAIHNSQLYQALEKSEERFRGMLDSMLEGCQIIDFDWCYQYINDVAEVHGRLSRERKLGRHITDVYPDIKKTEMFVLMKDCMENRIPHHAENEFIYPNGSKGWFDLSIAPIPEGIYLLSMDITERKQAKAQLEASLEEKKTLLQEVHHRVKNNLQLISSLLDFQAETIQDEQALTAFRESQNRIHAIASIHEALYQSDDLSRIDMAIYIQRLSSYISQFYGKTSVVLRFDIEHLLLDINTARSCGLLINELLSNALKHGFPDNGSGEIAIKMRHAGDQVELCVNDTGIGLPDDLDINSRETLGLRLVTMLTRQLHGTLRVTSRELTSFKITFTLPESTE